jgi:hypothetical protein
VLAPPYDQLRGVKHDFGRGGHISGMARLDPAKYVLMGRRAILELVDNEHAALS